MTLNSLCMYSYTPSKKKAISIMQEGKILEDSHSTRTIINLLHCGLTWWHAYSWNLSTRGVEAGRSGGLGQLWLWNMFKASLIFMRLCLKQRDQPITILRLEFVKKDLVFVCFRGWGMNPEPHTCYEGSTTEPLRVPKRLDVLMKKQKVALWIDRHVN